MIIPEVAERFIRYVKVDTESAEEMQMVPSTEKQKDLAKILKQELEELECEGVYMDERHGYVYAYIPSNSKKANLPAIGFIAHMDTSCAVSGKNVKPRVIENYDGKDIVLNETLDIVTRVADFKGLEKYKGQTLIVTDGTTLLGADDKAGVAEIMTMAAYLKSHQEIEHGKICIGFTPDEEVGKGVAFFDLARFGADYAYTVDGGAWGIINYENFNAAAAKVTIQGRSVHPGTAKNVMRNAILLAQEFQSMLPPQETPACTEGYEGFYHITDLTATVEMAVAHYIIRDHDETKFLARKAYFEKVVAYLNEKYGETIFKLEMQDTYYNMKKKIDQEIHLIDHAKKAMETLGIVPTIIPIRGGTDGAMLSYKGLCCPNLCTGSEAHH